MNGRLTWIDAPWTRLAACLTASAALLLAAGCGTSYPGDRSDWSLVSTPNAVEGATISGSLTLIEHTDDLWSAHFIEIVEDSKAGVDLLVDWYGDWELDGETVHLRLDCSSESAKNHPGVGCSSAKLDIDCTIEKRPTRTALDCGDYEFD